jgi:multicomponent Na+:H+ antiporter subunit F
MTAQAFLQASVAMALALVALAMFVALVRLVLGPTLPDRVVALDVVASLAVGAIAAMAVAFDKPVLLQPALVVALIAFVGTVAFARHLERKGP